MIEIAQLRVKFDISNLAPAKDGAQVGSPIAQRLQDVIAWLDERSAASIEAQAAAYKEQFPDERYAPQIHTFNDGKLYGVNGAKAGYDFITINTTSDFRAFLQKDPSPLIRHIEAQSGLQFMIFAGFIASPHQSNVGGWGSRSSLAATEFNRISYGLPVGRALTEGETQARIAMNDAVFEKLGAALAKLKENNPQLVVEAQEKQLGSIFLRVTSQDNREYGVMPSMVDYILRNLANDRENVSAVLMGPELYPSDVDALRKPPAAPQQPPVRAPKKLDL